VAPETPGGGWGSIASNDPGERGDSALPVGSSDVGSNPAPTGDICNEPFDPKYMGDGTSIWSSPGSVTNVPKSPFPQSSAKRPASRNKPFNPAKYG